MAAAKLCQIHKVNPSHFLKTAVVSHSVLPYTVGLAILLMFILKSMKACEVIK